MEIKEQQLRLLNQYLEKEEKELKSILLVEKSHKNNGNIYVVEFRLVVDKNKTDNEILKDFVDSRKDMNIAHVIHFVSNVVTNGEKRAAEADFIYKEYLKLCEENFENKLTNYSAAVEVYNSTLLPSFNKYPSEQFK